MGTKGTFRAENAQSAAPWPPSAQDGLVTVWSQAGRWRGAQADRFTSGFLDLTSASPWDASPNLA